MEKINDIEKMFRLFNDMAECNLTYGDALDEVFESAVNMGTANGSLSKVDEQIIGIELQALEKKQKPRAVLIQQQALERSQQRLAEQELVEEYSRTR